MICHPTLFFGTEFLTIRIERQIDSFCRRFGTRCARRVTSRSLYRALNEHKGRLVANLEACLCGVIVYPFGYQPKGIRTH